VVVLGLGLGQVVAVGFRLGQVVAVVVVVVG